MNLFNKHAVGLVFEKDQNGNVVSVKYLDSLNKEIPQELRQTIMDSFSIKINFQHIQVEQQKYANCGPEVIENFIQYLTGRRVSQEKAIELHSKLVENALLGIKSLGVHLLLEELTNYHQQTENNLKPNKDIDYAYNDQFHNDDYDNYHPALLGQDHNETI